MSRPAIVELSGSPWSTAPGAAIVKVDLAGTVVLLVVTALASVWDRDAADIANLVVAAVLFLVGCVAFAMGFVRAANRSRTELVDLAGLFYLTGSAPQGVRRVMLGLWFAQIAIAAASVVAVQPPFGVMAPVFGIGLLSLWAARHAVFPPRPLPGGPGQRSRPQ
ncbi:MAG: hypothetical protein JWM47_2804 [Acidimicrobiales bacterium]|nr:hypothetical protein [Acidimicrobiales bacterium]